MRYAAMLILIMTFCLGLADWGIAGPFGLSMGMKPSDLSEKLKADYPGMYSTTEVPKPHSMFVQYIMLFGPTTGLCRILAVSEAVATNPFGTELRHAFDVMEGRLKAQYGQDEKYDWLLPGAMWTKPWDFMTSLLKKERMLNAYWTTDVGSTLKDGLEGVVLQAQNVSGEGGTITVRYDFQNLSECQRELRTTEDDAL